LRGKVVAVDVWTYTCINWLRTLPYVRAWAEKYKKDGLVVIGVHSPEFSFEHDPDNVRHAVKAMRIDYPVAIDNDFEIWRGFDNHYWPALYLVDGKGRVRYRHFGEGEYEQSERAIQRLLTDNGTRGVANDLVSVDPQGFEVAADWGNLKSPESYLGWDRSGGFAGTDAVVDQRRVYSVPSRLTLNQWALAGDWTIDRAAATLNRPNGTLVYRFHARDANLVMGPATRGAAIRYRVRIDGQPPRASHGLDVDADGNGILNDQRLYQLVRQPTPIVDRLLEIEFLDPGAQALCFTFG
jgi:thiol-disulfide isomerase/thioredoxin